MGDSTDLFLQRVREAIEAAIAAERDPQRRAILAEDYALGDYHVQPGTRPGWVLICVGADDVGERSAVSLRRPEPI